MLNCIGNGNGAVSLMRLGSYVNHRSGPEASMEIQTRGVAGRNRIGFVARRCVGAALASCRVFEWGGVGLSRVKVTVGFNVCFNVGREIEEGEELSISYYGTDSTLGEAAKAKVLNQFMVEEGGAGLAPPT